MRFNKVSSLWRLCLTQGWDTGKLKTFCDDFQVTGYYWGHKGHAQYFLKLLRQGRSARPPYGSARTYDEYLRHHNELHDYSHVFDHDMTWSLSNRQVICTSMPYAERELALSEFAEISKTFSFPETVKLKILDDKYKYRINGDFMLVIYDEAYRNEARS